MSQGTRTPRFGWLVYLALCAIAIGSVLVPLLYAPCRLVGIVFPPARALADRVFVRGNALLMRLQRPWLEIAIDLRALEPHLRGHGKSGVLLVSNHRSHLDTFLLLSKVPGIRLLAKHTLFFLPLLGAMMWMTDQIPVRRKNLRSFYRAMDEIERVLRAGETVHVFPEMTRCLEGAPGVGEFTLAPFARAIAAGTPIVPLVFIDTDRAWPKGAHGIRSGATARLIALDAITIPSGATARSVSDSARAAIVDRLAHSRKETA